MNHYFAMGGYAVFIWPAYGGAAILMAGILILSWRTMRRREQLVEILRARRRKDLAEEMEAPS
jgi:heme exporter protein D